MYIGRKRIGLRSKNALGPGRGHLSQRYHLDGTFGTGGAADSAPAAVFGGKNNFRSIPLPAKGLKRTAPGTSAAVAAAILIPAGCIPGKGPQFGDRHALRQLMRKAAVGTAVTNTARNRPLQSNGNFPALHQSLFIGRVDDLLGTELRYFPADFAGIGKPQAGVYRFAAATHHGPAVTGPYINSLHSID